MKAQEIYEKVTNDLIAQIESIDTEHWRAPWHHDASHISIEIPTNAKTHKPYRGGNIVALWVASLVKGYESGAWATYDQWHQLGAQVRKGEKSTHGIKWVFPDEAAKKRAEAKGKVARAFPVGFAVFNAAQVDGWAPPEPIDTGISPIAAADLFFGLVGADISYSGNRAFYDRLRDRIVVPPLRQYDEPADFYATLAHEHTHWTGHKSRLDRDFGQRFGDDTYAFEELIAELTAAFLTARLGIVNSPRPDHAHYLKNWLRVLRSDPKAIFSASSAAQKAVDFLVKESGLDVTDGSLDGEDEPVDARQAVAS